jgi:hypothetical protein
MEKIVINKLIKLIYHLFSFIFLSYLSIYLKFVSWTIRIGLLFIALFHLYDTWWFYNFDKNAPI